MTAKQLAFPNDEAEARLWAAQRSGPITGFFFASLCLIAATVVLDVWWARAITGVLAMFSLLALGHMTGTANAYRAYADRQSMHTWQAYLDAIKEVGEATKKPPTTE